jgi:hypothetical protein
MLYEVTRAGLAYKKDTSVLNALENNTLRRVYGTPSLRFQMTNEEIETPLNFKVTKPNEDMDVVVKINPTGIVTEMSTDNFTATIYYPKSPDITSCSVPNLTKGTVVYPKSKFVEYYENSIDKNILLVDIAENDKQSLLSALTIIKNDDKPTVNDVRRFWFHDSEGQSEYYFISRDAFIPYMTVQYNNGIFIPV